MAIQENTSLTGSASDLDLAQRIDRACDAFESAWTPSGQSDLQSFLTGFADTERDQALHQLLLIELELRQQAGQSPSIGEYEGRFPASVVHRVFRERPVLTQCADGIVRTTRLAGTDPGGEAPELPEQFGRYRIIRELGKGAMGVVHLADDRESDRRVAIKVPMKSVLADPTLRKRFQREAAAAAVLRHPNICPIYDTGEVNGVPYICMAWIEGRPLSEFVASETVFSERKIAVVIAKLAVGLHEAHRRHILHRDMKPANIMIDLMGEPIIMDFGLARNLNQSRETKLTQTGTTIGSPAYMSPEQIDGDTSAICPASDVYSLGVILFELLTGQLPFQGTIGSVMSQILNDDPPRPGALRPGLSVRLELICEKMMAKKLSHRYRSMKDVAEALTDFLRRAAKREKAAAARLTESTPRVRDPRESVRDLVAAGEFARALEELEALATTESAEAVWANEQLPLISRQRDEIRDQRQHTWRVARQFYRIYDYEQAAQVLASVPRELRTARMQELYDDALAAADEVQMLQDDIDECERQGQFDGRMNGCVNRLLELKPRHQRAIALRTRLRFRRSKGPISRLLGNRTPAFLTDLPAAIDWLFFVGIVAAIAILIAGQVRQIM